MNLHLVDINPELVSAWQLAFRDYPEVEIVCDDILKVAADTIVSPANSYGFMDGGIDRLYTEFFGLQPQTEIQNHISNRKDELLPVGEAVLVRTGHQKIPYMICAPTMQSPGAIPPSNCFYAMSAILNAFDRNREYVSDVYCPGLGTSTGRLEPGIAADEMIHAYRKWKSRKQA